MTVQNVSLEIATVVELFRTQLARKRHLSLEIRGNLGKLAKFRVA